MKYLLIIAVVFLAYHFWRKSRATDKKQVHPRRGTPALPEDMVSCPVCALHLPRAEAVAGEKGLYCSADHRRQAEG
ncbi:MAG: PP0621 family protein [Burkholderiaceae bacterium]|nr:PP0621 family protein [Burkholderiaceae bacterium]MDO9090428.1 PP0621 family protein [Burkholderiaceae bacterium]